MKFYLTTPIYYVNAKPHIGHAYTTLAADVLARWHRLKGDEVFFLTGTDEHGNKVAQAARKVSKSNQEFCDEITNLFKKTWHNLNIKYDRFIRTTNPYHIRAVKKFILELKKRGAIYEATYEGLYCTGCENFVTQKELTLGKCPIHKRKPERIKERNWFFRLKDWLPRLKELIEEDKIKIKPEERRREALGLFKQELQDFSISREKVEWGIKLPWDKLETVYVWIDALVNYISAIGYDSSKFKVHPVKKSEISIGVQSSKFKEQRAKLFKKYWPADLHLIGKDILKFHCIYWPALLLASGLEVPNKIFVHGYFTVSGQKMSKTLGNIIDPNDLVNRFGVDGTRYLLLSQFPFGQDGDISQEKLVKKYNGDLANGLGNLVQRITKLVEGRLGQEFKTFKTSFKTQKLNPVREGAALNPALSKNKEAELYSFPSQAPLELPVIEGRNKQFYPNFVSQKVLTGQGVGFSNGVNKALEDLHFEQALRLIWQKITWLDQYINKEHPWKQKRGQKLEKVLNNLVACIKEIAQNLKPFMPETSQIILDQFSKAKIMVRDPLFPRIK